MKRFEGGDGDTRAWDGTAIVSSEPPAGFSFEAGELTPSYIEHGLLWLAEETARNGQVLLSHGLIRRARLLAQYQPALAEQVADAATCANGLALQHVRLEPKGSVQRRSVRVTFRYTLMRWHPLPPQFVGSGELEGSLWFSVPAAWAQDDFARMADVLTRLFEISNLFLGSREPEDPNYLSPTAIVAIDVLEPSDLLERAWERELEPPSWAPSPAYLVDGTVAICAVSDFVRLTYAGLAADHPQARDRIARIMRDRFELAPDAVADPGRVIASLLTRST